MKLVSDKYKDTMNQSVRPPSQFQAKLEMFDREVESGSTVTESPKEVFATSIFDQNHECDYITFEKDYFAVGGDTRILPESNYRANGFVSSVLTDANGNFAQVPTVEVELNSIEAFAGMTYTFAKTYPVQIRVTAYLDGTQVHQFISEPDGLEFVDDTNHIPECDRLRFEFLSMNAPYRRLRISRMVFGFLKIFSMGDMISTDHTLQIDPISTSLPYEKLTMQISNYDKDYNPDNPRGIWTYFEHGQPLQVQYGAIVDYGVEWIDAAYLFLNDAPTVDKNVAVFEAMDILSYMTGTYHKGLWRANGTSLYDLAVDIFADAGVSYYEIPISLQNVITYAPMPVLTHRECLQLIANAGRCTLYTDVSSKVVMKPYTSVNPITDFYLDFSVAMVKPKVIISEKLKSVDAIVHSYSVPSDYTLLYQAVDVDIYGEKEIRIAYNPATEISAIITDGELVSAVFYAETGFLTIRADSTVGIEANGKLLTIKDSTVSVQVKNTGESCPVNNPLISSATVAQGVGEWIADYLKSRNSYETNFRQDFRLDGNDIIHIQSEFEEMIPARITKLQYRLPGQEGAIRVRRLT